MHESNGKQSDIDGRVVRIKVLEGPTGIRPAMIGCRASMTGLDVNRSDSGNYDFGPRDLELANKLYQRGESHSAFLRMIWFWLEVKAPLYFWKQFDKYRFVNSLSDSYEERSESTMHSILKRPLTQEDFASPIPTVTLNHLNRLIRDKDFTGVINQLPGGYLQGRVINMNLTSMLAVTSQRQSHRLGAWADFINGLEEWIPLLGYFPKER